MKPTILIIDDTQIVLRYLAVALAPTFEVKLAGGALEALYAMTCELPDVILLDVRMPGLSGHDLSRLLRSNPSSATIPLVLMSGDRERLANYQEVGAQAALEKPIRTEIFVDLVRQMLSPQPQEGMTVDAKGGEWSASLIVLSCNGNEVTLVGEAPWGEGVALSLRYTVDGNSFVAPGVIRHRRNDFFDVLLKGVNPDEREKRFRWATEIGVRYRVPGEFVRLAKTKALAGNAIWVAGMPSMQPETPLELQVLLDNGGLSFAGTVLGTEEQAGQVLTKVALTPAEPTVRDQWTLFLFRGATVSK